jgi:hypothetical protein
VIANTTPPEIRHFFQATINEEVLQEGFGCQAEILDDLWRACQEHQRLYPITGYTLCRASSAGGMYRLPS